MNFCFKLYFNRRDTMKKLLSLMLALALCLGLALPASAINAAISGSYSTVSSGGAMTAAIRTDGSLWM